jgi:hypothetical protein
MSTPDIEVTEDKKTVKAPMQEQAVAQVEEEEKPEVKVFDKNAAKTRIGHIVEAGASVGKSLFGQEMPVSDKKILTEDWTQVAEDYNVTIPKWAHLLITIVVTIAIIHKTYKVAMGKVTEMVKRVMKRGTIQKSDRGLSDSQ